MSQAADIAQEPPKKASKLPLLIGLVLALAGAGGGYYAVITGLVLGHKPPDSQAETEMEPLPDVAFIPVDPIIVSMTSTSQTRHLQFRAQLEVPSKYQLEVETILPRVVDVLNGYLRALDITDLEDSSALTRLRSQMLRRVQIVTGQGRVSDLLIMEFVVN
jgi:flagellar FliL protein